MLCYVVEYIIVILSYVLFYSMIWYYVEHVLGFREQGFESSRFRVFGLGSGFQGLGLLKTRFGASRSSSMSIRLPSTANLVSERES